MDLYSDAEQASIRSAAFAWLDNELFAGKYEFRRKELQAFEYEGIRMPLVDAQKGIWNPKDFSSTVSIVSMLKSKYTDREDSSSGLLTYRYRSDGVDNGKLRIALTQRDPLIYFREVHDGAYVANYPVYVVADDSKQQIFSIALDEAISFFGDPLGMTSDERRYSYGVSKNRLHQPMFRAKVLRAYASTCAVCRLKHPDLLDAAHIISDSDAEGFATVVNGLTLCKLHHAAYDRNLLGITPDYVVRINGALLEEVDGPMLRHGLQEMDRQPLTLPRLKSNHPRREALDARFELFTS